MFESRIFAGTTEKLPGWAKHQAHTAAWSYDMEGHAQKCIERCYEPAKKKVEHLYRVSSPGLDDHQFRQEELGSVGELSEVHSSIVLKCLYLARIGRFAFFVFGQQACEICHFLDSGMRTDDRQHWFHTFITQAITGSMVLWETRLSIVDWVYSKPQTLPWRFEIDLGRILCICRKSNIRLHQLDVQETNVSIPQFYRIGYHFVGCLVANGWTTCSWVMGCGDRSVTFIEQYQIANQSSSRKLSEESHIQTQTKGKPRCW